MYQLFMYILPNICHPLHVPAVCYVPILLCSKSEKVNLLPPCNRKIPGNTYNPDPKVKHLLCYLVA